MKLNEALRLVIRQSGMGVLREKRLVAFLDDCQAFDDFPAMRQVMSAVAEGGYGEKLYSLAMKENNADYLRDAAGVKESWSRISASGRISLSTRSTAFHLPSG